MPSFRAIGLDNMPIELLKISPRESGTLLSFIFAIFYTYKVVPSIWRKARQSILLKSGKPRHLLDSYRTISVICHIRKLYESLLKRHLGNSGLLDMHRLQFGFKKRVGCPEALYVINELI
jgi:hypothetical protein